MDQGLRVHQVMEPRGLRSHARARQGALEKATWEVELKGLGLRAILGVQDSCLFLFRVEVFGLGVRR